VSRQLEPNLLQEVSGRRQSGNRRNRRKNPQCQPLLKAFQINPTPPGVLTHLVPGWDRLSSGQALVLGCSPTCDAYGCNANFWGGGQVSSKGPPHGPVPGPQDSACTFFWDCRLLQRWRQESRLRRCNSPQAKLVRRLAGKNHTPHKPLRAPLAAVAHDQSGEAAVAGAEEGHFKRAGDCGHQWPWRIQRLQHRRRRLMPLMPLQMHLLSSWANRASSR
jgi:hypothetical protein